MRKPTGEILAGNHTYAAALELGWDRVAVTYVDVDPAYCDVIVDRWECHTGQEATRP